MSNQFKVEFVDGSSDVVTLDRQFADCCIAKDGVVLLLCTDRIINLDNVKYLKEWSDQKEAEYIRNLVGSMYNYYTPQEQA